MSEFKDSRILEHFGGKDRALRRNPLHHFQEGFSFVELLVAAAILALTITVAAIAFSAITTSNGRGVGEIDVQLPAGTTLNFYGLTNSVVAVPLAPALGEVLRSEAMRDLLHEDLGRAVATYCLARTNITTFRPGTITVGPAFDGKSVVTPGQFRASLGAAGNQFVDYQGAASNAPSTSLFILQATTNAAVANVRAVYEMDVVPAVEPVGQYVSVRRYAAGALSAFYHAFYEGTNANNFLPPVVFFDRSIVASTGNQAIDRFHQAREMPFYFVWWPDPATTRFWETNAAMPAPATNQPRAGYSQMADRTSYFFVIPAFPAL